MQTFGHDVQEVRLTHCLPSFCGGKGPGLGEMFGRCHCYVVCYMPKKESVVSDPCRVESVTAHLQSPAKLFCAGSGFPRTRKERRK
jgi:hypothetical protein